MGNFIHEDFLLNNTAAKRLYHTFASGKPVIDFHCHLSAKHILEDRRYENLGEIWLEGDHYKWRAMRENGVSEKYCSGPASFHEKYLKWSAIVPRMLGNPLYHWTHLELARYFDIFELLDPTTAEGIFARASSQLQEEGYSTRALIRRMNVELICTTDDPVDDLADHESLAHEFEIKVLPTFRPDRVLAINEPTAFRAYLERLEQVSGKSIRNFSDLVAVLDSRHEFFHERGCRLSDHGLERFYFGEVAPLDPERIFKTIMEGIVPGPQETETFRTAIMLELCRMNYRRGWVQQFHFGAVRNNNERMFSVMGPDTGWDSIGYVQNPWKMKNFLSALDRDESLAKTILYNLNPSDNEMVITMGGNFNDGSVRGKVRYGAAWWFLDQKTGIEKNLRDLSQLGTLGNFIGMVTDSRSFLSYPRHEYFRRVACNFIGEEIEKGLIPDDDKLVGPMVESIVCNNAKDFFKL